MGSAISTLGDKSKNGTYSPTSSEKKVTKEDNVVLVENKPSLDNSNIYPNLDNLDIPFIDDDDTDVVDDIVAPSREQVAQENINTNASKNISLEENKVNLETIEKLVEAEQKKFEEKLQENLASAEQLGENVDEAVEEQTEETTNSDDLESVEKVQVIVQHPTEENKTEQEVIENYLRRLSVPKVEVSARVSVNPDSYTDDGQQHVLNKDNLVPEIKKKGSLKDKTHPETGTPSSLTPTSTTEHSPRTSPRCRTPVLNVSNPPSRKGSPVDPRKAKILVKTGNQQSSGTDSNVYIKLEDEYGICTEELKLDILFYDDLERGSLDSYKLELPEGFNSVRKLHLRRNTKGLGDSWFCDYIIVQDPRYGKLKKHRKIKSLLAPGTVTSTVIIEGLKPEYYFPVHRWVRPDVGYVLDEFGCSLPQCDPNPSHRRDDLGHKRGMYEYVQKIPGGPAQIGKLPDDEKFSDEYFWTFATEKAKLLTLTTFMDWGTSKWNNFSNFATIFKKFQNSLGQPKCVELWEEDRWFGQQRLSGTDCMLIRLCKDIPEKLAVDNQTVSEFLEGFTLDEALELNKMFVCDLQILDGVKCKDDRILAAPVALFYLNREQELMPVAIQLMQNKGPANPVFTPADPPSTWLVAKMFYNNAEAQHHQGVTHLGRTHILMEGVCVCTHRCLAPAHPIFKLLAPHFLYLLAINSRGLEKLVSVGGWVDKCMTQGVIGIFTVISRSIETWRADVHGIPEQELKDRGVLDPKILPNFPYRDDMLPLHQIIVKYVTTVLEHHYPTPEMVIGDTELQQWRREMTTPVTDGGLGWKGVPGGDEGFTCVSEVITICSSIISICSLGHASANFQQYDQYAFVPNYPGILMAPPPTEKREYDEKEILALLPDKRMTLDIILITKLLSKRGTNSLGDFEMQYMYDPVGVQAAKVLQSDLAKLSLETKTRNLDREFTYDFLDPAYVPNSISV